MSSEIELPGWHPSAADDPSPDVTIRRHEVPVTLDGATSKGLTWEMAQDRFLLRVEGIARFLLSGGRDIAFELEDGASPDDIAIFIVGTVFGILLHQRGQIVLHASAVCVGGKAVLFCGPSGAGKSTIAAALGQRGYPLLSDDVCALVLDGAGGPVVHSDGRNLKLWDHAVEKLDLVARRGERVRPRLEKYHVDPEVFVAEPLPLGAIYALREDRPPFAAGIDSPNVVDAALLLARNAYRPPLVRHMGQKANYFHAATVIANGVGVFHLTRALDFARMPGVVAQLERHWRAIGLIGTPA